MAISIISYRSCTRSNITFLAECKIRFSKLKQIALFDPYQTIPGLNRNDLIVKISPGSEPTKTALNQVVWHGSRLSWTVRPSLDHFFIKGEWMWVESLSIIQCLFSSLQKFFYSQKNAEKTWKKCWLKVCMLIALLIFFPSLVFKYS